MIAKGLKRRKPALGSTLKSLKSGCQCLLLALSQRNGRQTQTHQGISLRLRDA